MKKIALALAGSAAVLSLTARPVKVTVSNPADYNAEGRMVELQAGELRPLLGSRYAIVTDAGGNELSSQFTHDGLLIFPATVAAGKKATYTILPCDTLRKYPDVVWGRVYPERADDIAWENEQAGFRIYGPATQAKGEKAYGYDIFFKHPTPQLILPRLYAVETDPRTWQKADSLRKIDRKLSEEFINSISYHIDHGLGMDCYAVGPTLGDGCTALSTSEGLIYSWCYDKAEILDNGPLRFTVRLDFAPKAVGQDSCVVEHRLISLDSNSQLNRCIVWYDGMSETAQVVTGFPRRDNSPAIKDPDHGIIGYSDPTQGPDNGRAQLGAIIDDPDWGIVEYDDHILYSVLLDPGKPFGYYWGFSWDRAGIPDMDAWHQYLLRFRNQTTHPLKVKIK